MGHRINAFNTGPEKKKTSLSWDLAYAVGSVSLVFVIVGTVVITISGAFGIQHKAAQLVPQGVRDYLERETLVPVPPDLGQKARETIAAVAPTPETSRGRRESFAVGDSERTVLRIQGEPTSKSGNIWYYGGSQVTFLGGRVVGWNNASTHPLHVR